MSTTTNHSLRAAVSRAGLPPLEAGDHLDQKTFHARYEAMPDDVKAELIGGVVYMTAALRRAHGRFHGLMMHWLHSYEDSTPGVEAYDNATTIMADDSEPQPDACLIVHPDRGGQMRFTEDDYLEGAAEWAGEVATSTESYDLHSKKRDYERAGVREYVVVAARQEEVFWFVLRDGHFMEKTLDEDGCYRSSVFPGLWLDPVALLRLDSKRLLEVLQRGLATDEHSRFVRQLSEQGPDAS
ncbi:MAG: Uma2 family endonuclease [Rhodopirellula sp.]|nr:Uma2 family endonuclease [Rhodopirellula sp.]